jgi:precorrin-2 dehydrogenase/sirohydrochlorin ferrochelatase
MRGYPIVLTQLNQWRCVIIGGGQVAARKAQALVDAGAHPVIVSPQCVPDLHALVAGGVVTLVPRDYQSSDLDGASLVIAATDDRELNAGVASDCHRLGVLINVVDAPGLCSFTAPSVIRRGDLLVAISTDGQAPAFARHVRETLESVLDERYGELLAILASLRPRIRCNVPHEAHAALWDRLLNGEVIDCLSAEGRDAARELACSIIDEFCSAPARAHG